MDNERRELQVEAALLRKCQGSNVIPLIGKLHPTAGTSLLDELALAILTLPSPYGDLDGLVW